jgi:hypothetical protein
MEMVEGKESVLSGRVQLAIYAKELKRPAITDGISVITMKEVAGSQLRNL